MKLVIAIDGHSSCGKSTLAKRLAQQLDYLYIDSGAMYRAVTLYLVRHHIDLSDHQAVEAALPHIHIHLRPHPEGGIITYLNEENVEEEIRSMAVSKQVSQVSAIPAVREYLVAQQRKYGANKGIVMDGRDIGTVVFPQAELKIFLTASPEIRAQRRYKELTDEGIAVTFAEVLKNVQERDRIDTTRAVSPLQKADDAIEIDNSDMNQQETLTETMRWVQEKQATLQQS